MSEARKGSARVGRLLRCAPHSLNVRSHAKMKRENKEFTLMPATVDDIDFIYDLRVKTMKPFFDGTFGWNEAKEQQFPLYPEAQ